MNEVTVITPVFNTQDYLHRCIKSVLGQENVDLRYILVDDGSTDNSARIIDHYQNADPRVLYVRQPNRGQGPARNLGLSLADSEFVYFVDSDDHLGENSLSILLETAREFNLDLCSPQIPDHYFSKPLELTPCLPNKAQFVRRDIIEHFQIEQPDVRSGQDGVFSHLVLTHCKRVGMATEAEYHYTHARPGSTFQSYLKKHDQVPGIVQKHLEFIADHYDKWRLWFKNSDRLLSFILDETLRNRLLPHYDDMTIEQRAQCFASIFGIVDRCLSKSRIITKDSHPVIAMFAEFSEDSVGAATRFSKEELGLEVPLDRGYPRDSFRTGTALVAKYSQRGLEPDRPGEFEKPFNDQAKIQDLSNLSEEGETLANKLDLVANSLNNLSAMSVHAHWFGPPSLAGCEEKLIVNLTALPHRLPSLHLVLASIYQQTRKPSKIILWLPDDIDIDKQTPLQLAFYMDKGFEIRSVRDVGPHTKLLYALKEFPDHRLITIDDDIVYPVNMIQSLLAGHEKFPDAIVANWARELSFDANGEVLGIRKGRLLTPPTLESDIEQAEEFKHVATLEAFPYGTSGVLYPPGCFDELVFDERAFHRLCPKEDDIWFKACSILKGTKVVTTNLGTNPVHHCLSGSQDISLRHFNHTEAAKNESQMRKVFRELDLYRYFDGV